jgi:hypothetical protein
MYVDRYVAEPNPQVLDATLKNLEFTFYMMGSTNIFKTKSEEMGVCVL